jgi:hypothetical protein
VAQRWPWGAFSATIRGGSSPQQCGGVLERVWHRSVSYTPLQITLRNHPVVLTWDPLQRELDHRGWLGQKAWWLRHLPRYSLACLVYCHRSALGKHYGPWSTEA